MSRSTRTATICWPAATARGHDAGGRVLRRGHPARSPGSGRRHRTERAIPDPPTAGVSRAPSHSGEPTTARPRCASSGRRGDRSPEREHRAQGPDASSNPYLGLTAMLACGLGGIEDGAHVPSRSSRIPAAGLRSSATRAACGASPRASTSRSRASRRPSASARRSAIPCQRVHRRPALRRRVGRGQERRGDHRGPPLALLRTGFKSRVA